MMGRRIAMRRTCEQGIKDYYRSEASSAPHTRLLAGRSHGEPVQACAHAPGPTAVHSTRTVQKTGYQCCPSEEGSVAEPPVFTLLAGLLAGRSHGETVQARAHTSRPTAVHSECPGDTRFGLYERAACVKGAAVHCALDQRNSRPQTRRRPQAITPCPRRAGRLAGRLAGRPAGSHAQWVSSGIPCFAPHGAGKENSSLRSVWAGSSPPWSVGRSFTRIPPAGVCVRPGSTSGSSSPSHCGSSSFCSLFFWGPTLETSGQVCWELASSVPARPAHVQQTMDTRLVLWVGWGMRLRQLIDTERMRRTRL